MTTAPKFQQAAIYALSYTKRKVWNRGVLHYNSDLITMHKKLQVFSIQYSKKIGDDKIIQHALLETANYKAYSTACN